MAEKSFRKTIADQLRQMKVGDTIQFPIADYNPNTIRSTPATTLLKEMSEGMRWRTKANLKDKCIDVTRVK